MQNHSPTGPSYKLHMACLLGFHNKQDTTKLIIISLAYYQVLQILLHTYQYIYYKKEYYWENQMCPVCF